MHAGKKMILSRYFVYSLAGICFLFLTQGCGLVVRETQKGLIKVADSEIFWQGRHGKLTEQEMEWAKIAWQYFINNYNAATGIVNGSNAFNIASVWNIADTVAATVAAHRLDLIDNYEFDHHITSLLTFLNSMPLSYGVLPNAFYNTANGKMTNIAGEEYSVGWSAIDIGRLLIWLNILGDYAPQYIEYIDKAILRWNFCKAINECGELSGVNRHSSKNPPLESPKEPIGYYEYALMGYKTWGFSTPAPYRKKTPFINVYGIQLPTSKEDSRETGISDPLVSLPYLLLGLEFNWDRVDDHLSSDSYSSNSALADLAKRIYDVQEKRYQYKRIFTARTSYRRNTSPYLIYNSIFTDGYAWNTLTPEGEQHADLSLVSNAAAFAMWALWKTSYTDGLMQLLNPLHDPKKGWFEGRRERDGGYERTMTCSTNAVILEVLAYKMYGKLYSNQVSAKSYADILMENEFDRPPCSPLDLKECRFKAGQK
ncbi:MAG: DUF3131 domain-containing protein [Candidatus Electrothrix sp. AW1]|nr:DUF3131 domain-containing protein [Candidatus Electrothrix sp. AX1]MCI5181067.1 DUF3131 domain-containing protein [Candidatus Electrothrix gigas]